MKRREFLSSTLAIAAAGLAPRSARASEGLVEILLDEPIGEIAPELQGHFTEHIGEVVYNGIWVGEDSKIPNIGGIRKALVEHMRQLHAPVIRWPGGCFADSYNWRDGIGPRTSRPVRTNFGTTPRNCATPLQVLRNTTPTPSAWRNSCAFANSAVRSPISPPTSAA